MQPMPVIGEMRIIFHVDLDAFFCSVEELITPDLEGKAFVVGGSPQGRGVVSSASYPARSFGIRNAMPTSQALRLCPRLIVVPVRHAIYSEHSHRVMALLRDYGRSFEQLSIDEAFLDVTGIREDPYPLALEVQSRIRNELSLPASIGVASNKLVAKMASGLAKPNGILVVEEGREAEFLAPLPVRELWGIGKVTAAKLHSIGIKSIGELVRCPLVRLQPILGRQAQSTVLRAQGIDQSPVYTEHDAKSISSERTFAHDVSEPDELRHALLAMCDEISIRLRSESLFARTVQLKLRWPDFETVTRQSTLPSATQLGDDLFAVIEGLWIQIWSPGNRVRLLGVAASELKSTPEQLSLFDSKNTDRRIALAQATDRLRAKYGDKVIGRASLRKSRSR